jgi:hypothetical protein
MKHLKKFNEDIENDNIENVVPHEKISLAGIIPDEEMICVPLSTFQNWIDSLDSQEYDLNQTLYAKSEMEKFLSSNKPA